MEQKSQKNGLINLLALVLVSGLAFAVARYGNTLAGLVTTLFLGIGALVAAVSWFQMRLEEREHLEKLEFQELTKAAGSSALFNASEAEVFPAQRSREQFERIFVPAFAVLLFILQAGGAFMIWRWLGKLPPMVLYKPASVVALMVMFGIVLFILGKYSNSLARINKLRLLRPGGSYLLLNAYLLFAVAIVLAVFTWFLEYPKADWYTARVLSALLLVVAVETFVNLLLELYRPRVKGKVERPIYESRLVSLLGQPEGLITTAAQTLDYQFGFKVSETWAYRLFEQWLPRLIIIQLVVLLGSTCFVFIEAGQEGLLERNGAFVRVLKPGANFKWPWPIDTVERYATERIQSVNVGFVPDESPMTGNVVLWTVPHTKEENFLVANRSVSRVTDTNSTTESRPPPVSLLTVSIPVQFQITNLEAWAYNNEDPVGLLEHISTREVVHYFVSADLQEVMSQGRWEAGQILRQRIQADADAHKMGASIVFVGLQDIHPPGKVAPDYEKVVSAIHTREAVILAAQADAIRSTNLADAQAFRTISQAQSSGKRREVEALAQAALFTNQIPAYLASPSVYAERAYLDTFARSVTNARLYVVLATNTQDVVILDLEDKLRKGLEDVVTVPPPKPIH